MFAPLKDIYDSKLLPECQRNIILITDGEIGNESDIYSLVKERPTRLIFSVASAMALMNILSKLRIQKGGGACIASERIEPKVLRLYKRLSPKALTI